MWGRSGRKSVRITNARVDKIRYHDRAERHPPPPLFSPTFKFGLNQNNGQRGRRLVNFIGRHTPRCTTGDALRAEATSPSTLPSISRRGETLKSQCTHLLLLLFRHAGTVEGTPNLEVAIENDCKDKDERKSFCFS